MATEFATTNGTSHRLICCTFQKVAHSHIMVIKNLFLYNVLLCKPIKVLLLKCMCKITGIIIYN